MNVEYKSASVVKPCPYTGQSFAEVSEDKMIDAQALFDCLRNSMPVHVDIGVRRGLTVIRAQGPYIYCLDKDGNIITMEGAAVKQTRTYFATGYMDEEKRSLLRNALWHRNLFVPVLLQNADGTTKRALVPSTAIVEYDSGIFVVSDENAKLRAHGNQCFILIDEIQSERVALAEQQAEAFVTRTMEFAARQTIYHRRTGEPVVVIRVISAAQTMAFKDIRDAYEFDMIVISGSGAPPFAAHSFEYTADQNEVSAYAPRIYLKETI